MPHQMNRRCNLRNKIKMRMIFFSKMTMEILGNKASQRKYWKMKIIQLKTKTFRELEIIPSPDPINSSAEIFSYIFLYDLFI